jgi:hypothetical protein
MSNSTGVLWRILREGNPVAVVFYPELITRDALIEEVKLLAPPERTVIQSSDVNAAFQNGDVIVLLTPDDQEAAVATLDRRREEMRDRTAPAVLFLLCDGSGEQRLREAFALASWLRGREYDPTRPQTIDTEAARRAFEERTGQKPEQWLAAWQAGELPDTLENNLLSHEALLLRRSKTNLFYD